MAAYLLCRVKVDDPEVYAKYAALSPAIVAKFGGRFLARGGPVITLEGEPVTERLVILEFPSTQAATDYYNSHDYQQAKAIRAPVSQAEFLVIGGV